jgi:hypothetical protein
MHPGTAILGPSIHERGGEPFWSDHSTTIQVNTCQESSDTPTHSRGRRK